ncbi:MAG: 2Fe-2S iron-sulfur cluster-binding protein [Myxococcota bacterium]
MATITIDGASYEVSEGRTILQALDDLGLLLNGVDIPHYCWHPKLSIDGSCRMCQVEIEGLPKLQIACNTPVRDGMVIRTRTEQVRSAQRGVMELLLLNHPLDCPICDQAGECTLQDYAFEYGAKHARTREPRRPAKKGVALGPGITFDQERCILCRRCVRFCREVPGTRELGVFERGDRSLLDTFPGRQLDNPYSMNVADICPVGALTVTDFRFKIRVWFLDDVESVCNQCSKGCNIVMSRAQNRIYRYLPRRNDSVNDTWMCDEGRRSDRTIRDDRLESPRVEGRVVPFPEAVRAAADRIREARDAGERIVGVASAFAPNEDLFAFRRLLEALGAGPGVFRVPRGEADGLLVQAERAPNAAGARALGFQECEGALPSASLAIVLGHAYAESAFTGIGRRILIDSHRSPLVGRSAVVLPSAHLAERDGTFVNCDGRVQRFRRAIQPLFEAWPEGDIVHQIAEALALEDFASRFEVSEVSKQIAQAVPAFAGRDWLSLDDQGAPLGSES